MTQKMITELPTLTQIQAAAAAIATARAELARLVNLTSVQKRKSLAMGERSEPFCRRALEILASTPQLLPPTLAVPEARLELTTHEQLRPLLRETTLLHESLSDTLYALGAQAYATARQGYGYLKAAGRTMGLKEYERELSTRFAGQGARAPKTAEQ